MALRIVTDATAEPVSLADLKIHLRLSTVGTAEDAYLTGLITGTRKLAENKMGRACLPQTWKVTLDNFRNDVVLPIAPLSSATADVVITYLDAASGDSTTLPSTYYRIDSESQPGRIQLEYGSDWPDVYPVRNAVTIQFVAGYALTSADEDTTPEPIETWIKMRAAGLYENRESVGEKGLSELPYSFLDGLLDPYVLLEVGP